MNPIHTVDDLEEALSRPTPGAIEALRGLDGDVVVLGAGSNAVTVTGGMAFIATGGGNDTIAVGGTGNTINAGGGTNVIHGGAGGDTFVLPGAGGGFDTITGFTETNGDVLDLSRVLAGSGAASDLSNLSSYVMLTQQADTARPSQTDTVLSVKGISATTSITLLNTGTMTLSDLVSHSSIVVAHSVYRLTS